MPCLLAPPPPLHCLAPNLPSLSLCAPRFDRSVSMAFWSVYSPATRRVAWRHEACEPKRDKRTETKNDKSAGAGTGLTGHSCENDLPEQCARNKVWLPTSPARLSKEAVGRPSISSLGVLSPLAYVWLSFYVVVFFHFISFLSLYFMFYVALDFLHSCFFLHLAKSRQPLYPFVHNLLVSLLLLSPWHFFAFYFFCFVCIFRLAIHIRPRWLSRPNKY